MLKYKNINIDKIFEVCDIKDISRRAKENLIFTSLYENYISRQYSNIEEMKKNQSVKIPENFNYKELRTLSNEEVEKLEKAKPETIHQASRISGITPTSILAILNKINNS